MTNLKETNINVNTSRIHLALYKKLDVCLLVISLNEYPFEQRHYIKKSI